MVLRSIVALSFYPCIIKGKKENIFKPTITKKTMAMAQKHLTRPEWEHKRGECKMIFFSCEMKYLYVHVMCARVVLWRPRFGAQRIISSLITVWALRNDVEENRKKNINPMQNRMAQKKHNRTKSRRANGIERFTVFVIDVVDASSNGWNLPNYVIIVICHETPYLKHTSPRRTYKFSTI